MSFEVNPLFTREIDRLDMNVSEAYYASLDRGTSYSCDSSSFNRVYCICSGVGQISCSGKAALLEPGNIYIVPVGAEFSYICNTALEKLYFHINILRYNKYDLFSGINECIIFKNRQEEIAQAVRLWRNKDIISVFSVKQWLYSLMAEAIRTSGSDFGQIEEYSSPVKLALRYIENNLHSGMTASEIASAVFVSESRLQKSFRSELGVPLGHYINDRLLFIAERQLRLTSLPVKDISDELGFCDPFYFSRMFSRRYGLSPSLYRKRLKP